MLIARIKHNQIPEMHFTRFLISNCSINGPKSWPRFPAYFAINIIVSFEIKWWIIRVRINRSIHPTFSFSINHISLVNFFT